MEGPVLPPRLPLLVSNGEFLLDPSVSGGSCPGQGELESWELAASLPSCLQHGLLG
jgi:hypothetical protein